jgi:DNA replication protein DnaC
VARACPHGACDGSGLVVDDATRTATYCRCRDRLVAERRARGLSAVIPKRYRDAGFDRPPVTEVTPAATVSHVRRYTYDIDARLDAGEGLWLYGGNGTGKTTLAMIVARAALDAGRTVAVYSLPRLLSEIRETYDDDHRNYLEFLDRLAGVDLLQLDDVGAERTNPWVLEQLYAVVNSRYEERRSIVLTTNLQEADEIAEQIGVRTVSRLTEMCEVLPVIGRDQRKPRNDLEQFAGRDDAATALWDVA